MIQVERGSSPPPPVTITLDEPTLAKIDTILFYRRNEWNFAATPGERALIDDFRNALADAGVELGGDAALPAEYKRGDA